MKSQVESEAEEIEKNFLAKFFNDIPHYDFELSWRGYFPKYSIAARFNDDYTGNISCVFAYRRTLTIN